MDGLHAGRLVLDGPAILDLIGRHTRAVLPQLEHHTFTRADRLQELGATSMDRAEIVTALLESLSLRIPRVELFGPRNLGELADLLHAKLGRT
jgi:polyketide biosynthesis acyl carrier protein